MTELEKINKVIDEDIRPFLQRDGGDLQVLDYKDKTLTIHYQGACGSCPHAAMGTLFAIQNVLQEKFDKDIEVKMG